ncbi:M28 family peptidase [Akkermansiaceae bacterium]|nr:M28 family peptidase [Akkermansiaceae bacterium]MDB4499068.1 M28 family peptidase [Akkermansiaceae bacterium]MDC1206625.1 M28 family peptidase [Akkermansiaceae bacterium]
MKLPIFLIAALLVSCGERETPERGTTSKIVEANVPIPAKLVQEFSGEKALEEVKMLTSFGPRPPESEGYRKSLAYLEKTLGALGWRTTRQTFKSITPIGQVEFTNLIARFSPDSEVDWNASVPFVIGSHLDTKRYVSITFLGANDSGSSSGVLVEMARVLAQSPESAGQVELVFFDGEEAMLTNIDPKRDGLYGSRYYAAELNRRTSQPKSGILLDLVGDTRVPLLIGTDSHKRLKRQAVDAAKKLKMTNTQIKHASQPIIDDHLPLRTRGNLAMLHLIGDFNKMPYWHTEDDTLDQISAAGLVQSGKLTMQILVQMTALKAE